MCLDLERYPWKCGLTNKARSFAVEIVAMSAQLRCVDAIDSYGLLIITQ